MQTLHNTANGKNITNNYIIPLKRLFWLKSAAHVK